MVTMMLEFRARLSQLLSLDFFFKILGLEGEGKFPTSANSLLSCE